jgi:hypothetical protein
MKLIILAVVVGGLLLFGLIQLVPYGRSHQNPAVVREYAWPSAEAKLVAERACYDCHSNETVWPWYSNVAPMSWLVQRDVDEGRQHLNFSDWGSGEHPLNEIAEEIGETVQEGEMPPMNYVLLHPEAKLSAAEIGLIVQSFPGGGGGEAQGESEED